MAPPPSVHVLLLKLEAFTVRSKRRRGRLSSVLASPEKNSAPPPPLFAEFCVKVDLCGDGKPGVGARDQTSSRSQNGS